jgi:hypothetical protein
MKWLGPMGVLLVAIGMFSAFQVAFVIVETTRAEAVSELTSFGLALTFVLWILLDAQRRRQIPCYDFGFLVAVFFPLSLGWYVFWSRGWRGIFLLVALLGLILVPQVSASVAWTLRHGTN